MVNEGLRALRKLPRTTHSHNSTTAVHHVLLPLETPPAAASQVNAISTATLPPTMQQIMDEELVCKLYEDECRAREARIARDAATSQELAASEDEGTVDDSDYEQEQDEDDEDDYDDYMDLYSVANGKSVQMIGQYVPLANSAKGFNSLRETMRRAQRFDAQRAGLG